MGWQPFFKTASILPKRDWQSQSCVENEQELLERIQTGDEKALLALHTEYAGLVYSVVFRILGNQQDAEEVTQDAFMSLWHKSGYYSPQKGNFVTWFLTLAKRLAIDYWRRNKDRLVPQLSIDETTADQTEHNHALNMIIAELPREQQEALQLAYFYGMSHREIAEYTGRPLGTVKTHIREGMKKLRVAWLSHDE